MGAFAGMARSYRLVAGSLFCRSWPCLRRIGHRSSTDEVRQRDSCRADDVRVRGHGPLLQAGDGLAFL